MTLLLVALTAALAAEHLLFRFVLRPKRGEFLKSGKQGDNAAAVAAVSGLSVLGGYLLAFLLTGSCALLPSAGLTLLLSGGALALALLVFKAESGVFLAAAPVNALLTVLLSASRITADTLEAAAVGGAAAALCCALTVMIYASLLSKLSPLCAQGAKKAAAPIAATALLLLLAYSGFSL